MSADDLLPITEADVVPGAEFVEGNCVHQVVAVRDGYVFTLSTLLRDEHYTEGDAWRMAAVLKYFRKRVPKPPRHTVELRPPKAGERYLSVWGGCVDGASVDYAAPRWVIVDDGADQ